MTPAPQIAERIEFAAGALRRGGVVSFPTDTLYALGADALNDAAVARVFAIKARPLSNPLPLFVSDAAMAGQLAVLTPPAVRLVERFWPGALTVVIEKRDDFESLALAGGATVALRAPDHPVALDLIRRLQRPLTATSANLSGGIDPDSAGEVRRQLGHAVDYIIDAGPCPIGMPSTIVDCTSAPDIRIVRPGAIAESEVRKALAAAG
jgi:L-threonylcarbamoyladenylate synthase